MFKYQDFILEKYVNLILESLENEQLFILSDELCDILTLIHETEKKYSKIANLFLNLDITGHEKLNMSYFDVGDDNQSIKFLDPVKANKLQITNDWTHSQVFKNVDKVSTIKIGRLTKKVIELYNKKFEKDLKFTDSEIEDFINAYKSYYDFKNNKMDSLKLMSGNKINYYYAEENYNNSNGTLGNSCMRYDECNDYLDLYNGGNVNLLVLMTPNNKISARALVWELTDGTRFMDRIYTNDDSDINLFIKWCEDNSCSYKFEQNSKTGAVCLYENNFEPQFVKLESIVNSTNFENRKYEKFPYMDTLKYYYWKEGVVRNFKESDGFYVELEDTDGWCSCKDCGNYGTKECETCSSSGTQACESCTEDGCEECNLTGEKECVVCLGKSEVVCNTCGGFSST